MRYVTTTQSAIFQTLDKALYSIKLVKQEIHNAFVPKFKPHEMYFHDVCNVSNIKHMFVIRLCVGLINVIASEINWYTLLKKSYY